MARMVNGGMCVSRAPLRVAYRLRTCRHDRRTRVPREGAARINTCATGRPADRSIGVPPLVTAFPAVALKIARLVINLK